jgi:uncharacterized protein (DUF2132 family)
MADEQLNNPLHGITLKALLTGLVEEHGWEYLAERVKIQCFSNEPSIKSSLTFLRKTPWARAKVEGIYLSDFKGRERKRKRNLRRAARRAYAESVKDGTVERMVILSDVELAMTDATPSPVEEVVTEEAGLTATSEMTEEAEIAATLSPVEDVTLDATPSPVVDVEPAATPSPVEDVTLDATPSPVEDVETEATPTPADAVVTETVDKAPAADTEEVADKAEEDVSGWSVSRG